MTVSRIIQELCKREGLKRQVNVAQMSEIVGHISDMFYCSTDEDLHKLVSSLHENGRRRWKRKPKAKAKTNARGNPEAGLKSGAAIALMQSIAKTKAKK